MMTVNPSLIKILGVNVVMENISSTEKYQSKPVRPNSVRVDYQQESAFNFEEKKIRIRLSFSLYGKDNEGSDIGLSGSFKIDHFFSVENFDDFVVEENSTKKVDGNLGITLASIAYSTCRGIILERTHGTYFNGVVLQVINPSDMLIEESKGESQE